MRGLPLRAELSRISPVTSIVVVGLLLAVAGVGCGPIEYIANVPLDAAGALSEARQVDADKFAPYELTAAEQYIHKSRELAGYARFHSAVEFGRKAAESSRKARQIALDKSRIREERSEAPASSEPTTTEVKTIERVPEPPGKVIVVPVSPSK